MTHGGSAPKPYRQREAKTLFLRVPHVDWTKVKIGEKTEFRTTPHESSKIITANLPTPVVAYAVNGYDEYDAKLMVLEGRRHEPLWEIANDVTGLRREGYGTYDEFRRYWRKRQKGVYRPLQMVWVWQVREFRDEDIIVEGARLLRRLYGEFLLPYDER